MVLKAYGCVVVDTDTRSIKAFHIPVILDLVQDRVRNRIYSVLLTLLIIISAAYWALGPAFHQANFAFPPPEAAGVKIVMPVEYVINYGDVLSPPLVATVVSSDNSLLANRVVTIVAVPINLNDNNELALAPYRAIMGNTFSQVSDQTGTVQFKNVTFSGNSQVQYKIYCICENVTSNYVLVTVKTRVSSIEFVTTPFARFTPSIGEPISFPFSILVLAANSVPVSNKEVIATINPTADVNIITPTYGILQNFKVVTNSQGIAVFDSLTIVAATQTRFNFLFSSDGVTLTPSITDLVIDCVSSVSQLKIAQPPPTSVVEGQTFPASTTVTVLDSDGSPVSGKIVIAVVTTEANYSAFPSVFSEHKILHNVVSAPTDKNGRASFDKLMFDISGRAGQYGITFFCDGVASDEAAVYVQSIVATLQLLSPIPDVIPMISITLSTPLLILLAVFDHYNNPIQNKAVDIEFSNSWADSAFDQSTTDENGKATFVVQSLPFVSDFSATNTTVIKLKLVCEGVSLEVTFLAVRLEEIYTITTVQIISPPSGVYNILSTTGFQPVVRVADSNGNPTPNVEVVPTFSTWSGDSAESIFYDVRGSAETDENGIATFNTFGLLSGGSGAITIYFAYLQFSAYSSSVIVQVYNPITSIVLSMPDFDTSNSTIYQVLPGNFLSLAVELILDEDISDLQALYPQLVVLQGEYYYKGAYTKALEMALFSGTGNITHPPADSRFDQNWGGYISPISCVGTSSSSGTCSFGNVTVNGYPGRFTVAVIVAGVISNSITLEIGSNVVSLVPLVYGVDVVDVTLGSTIDNVAVRVLGDQGIPLVGLYVSIFPCNQSSDLIIADMSNSYIPLSVSHWPSDASGTAKFWNIQVLSGSSGEYSLCFGLNDLEPVVWNVTVNFTTPIDFFRTSTLNSVYVPGDDVSLDFQVSANSFSGLSVSAPVEFIQIDGPMILPFNFENPYCDVTTDSWSTCVIRFTFYQQAVSGFYTFAPSLAGYTMEDTINFLVVREPRSLQIYSLSGYLYEQESSVFNSTLFKATTFVVTATAINDRLLPANLTLSLLPNPSSSPCKFDTSSRYNGDSGATYISVVFTYAASGTYQFLLETYPLQYTVTFNITNPVANISLAFEGDLIEATVGVAVGTHPVITAVPQPGVNCSDIQGQTVTALLKGYTGETVRINALSINDSCMAVVTGLTFLVAVPGTYLLQFDIAGIISSPITVLLSNPAYPNYEHLDLHHAQEKLVLGVLLMIPLYIGNSARQPAWQLAISLPVLAVIGYISYTYLHEEIVSQNTLRSFGYAYYALDMSLRAILIFTALGYIVVVGIQVFSSIRNRPTTFIAKKVQASRVYVRHSLLSYGMKRYNAPKELIAEKKPLGFFSRIALFFKKCGPSRDDNHHNAFFYPQRLLLGFATSLVCCFIVACACYQLTAYVLAKLDKLHTTIFILMNAVRQLQDFVGGTGDFFFNGRVNEIASIVNISPQQFQVLMDDVYKGSSMSLYYGNSAENAIVYGSALFHRTALMSLGVTSVVLIVAWYFVFINYKHRILLLRRGRGSEITFNKRRFTIDKAATYIGLQALHATCAFFTFWFIATAGGMIVQLPKFWAWIWSYFPLLVAFLLGVPFLSKTITKFIISKWVLKNNEILHLRVWLIFDFMWIFVNMLSTTVLSVLRFAAAGFISIIYTLRMDYPILREQYDYYDYGFHAYMGMLLMDHSNNNPVFLQFCELLIEDLKKARSVRKKKLMDYAEGKSSLLNPVIEEPIQFYAPLVDTTRKRVVAKWWLLITLHNNPSLLVLRKHVLDSPQL